MYDHPGVVVLKVADDCADEVVLLDLHVGDQVEQVVHEVDAFLDPGQPEDLLLHGLLAFGRVEREQVLQVLVELGLGRLLALEVLRVHQRVVDAALDVLVYQVVRGAVLQLVREDADQEEQPLPGLVVAVQKPPAVLEEHYDDVLVQQRELVNRPFQTKGYSLTRFSKKLGRIRRNLVNSMM